MATTERPRLQTVRGGQAALNGRAPLPMELPPHTVEAEQAVLGAALCDEEMATALPGLLNAEDFYNSFHRRVYSAAATLGGDGKPVDPISVLEYLKPANAEDRRALFESLSRLVDERCVPCTRDTLEYHAEAIKEKARLRALHEVRDQINSCIRNADSSTDALSQAQELLGHYERRVNTHQGGQFGFSSAWLQREPFTPIRWAVPGLLPEGLGILGGRPKQGKSWWALQACAAIALGNRAFSKIEVEQGPVLYLGLEDSQRRLQKRLQLLLGSEPWPELLLLNTRWPKLSEGGIGKLARYFREVKPRLVVLDTYARVRDTSDPRANAYDSDTASLAPLQNLAMEHHVCVLLILHLRKMPSDDWIDAIAGSTGLSGVPDALLGLFRKRGERAAELKITGRDIDERELAYRLDEHAFWIEEGPAAEVARTYEEREVCEALHRAGRSLPPAELAKRLGIKTAAAQQRLYRMADRGLLRVADGHYSNLPGYVSTETDTFAVSPVNAVNPVNPVETVSVGAAEQSTLTELTTQTELTELTGLTRNSGFSFLPPLEFNDETPESERGKREACWQAAGMAGFPPIQTSQGPRGGGELGWRHVCRNATIRQIEAALAAFEQRMSGTASHA